MRTARQHALALVEAEHHLLVLRRPLCLGPCRRTLDVAVPQMPLPICPQDERLDMPQLPEDGSRHPVEELAPPRLAGGPGHCPLLPEDVVARTSRLPIAFIRVQPVHVQRNQAPRELPGDHPEAGIGGVRLVRLQAELPRQGLGRPLLDVGGLAGHRHESPPVREDILAQHVYSAQRQICGRRRRRNRIDHCFGSHETGRRQELFARPGHVSVPSQPV